MDAIDLMRRWGAKVAIPDDHNGCWMWSGYCDPNGYGRLNISRKSALAHRVGWELFRGPLNNGLCALHRCDTPGCVNPDHAFSGTQVDNIRDAQSKHRIPSGRAHWTQSPENAHRKSRGERNGHARLTAEAVAQIRATRPSTSVAALAKLHGVSVSAIYHIGYGSTWKHTQKKEPACTDLH